MTVKAVSAGRDNRGLKLQDRLVSKAGGIREIAGRPADRCNQPVVRIDSKRNLMRKGGHG
jgi:hypothetical protein